VTSALHVVVENIVGHLRATYLARVDVESVVNATPDAAIRLVIADLKEAHVRLGVHNHVASGVPLRRKGLRIAPQHVASMREAPLPMQVMLLEYAG